MLVGKGSLSNKKSTSQKKINNKIHRPIAQSLSELRFT
jgi:hypothetical protein